MAELIDRWAALEKMCDDCKKCGYNGHCPCPAGVCHKYESILQVPTAEAESVRRGQWIHIRTAGVISIWKCSECDSTITANFAITNPANHDKFCYNCGAKMDGGKENGLN